MIQLILCASITDNCRYNVIAESFFKSLKTELFFCFKTIYILSFDSSAVVRKF